MIPCVAVHGLEPTNQPAHGPAPQGTHSPRKDIIAISGKKKLLILVLAKTNDNGHPKFDIYGLFSSQGRACAAIDSWAVDTRSCWAHCTKIYNIEEKTKRACTRLSTAWHATPCHAMERHRSVRLYLIQQYNININSRLSDDSTIRYGIRHPTV